MHEVHGRAVAAARTYFATWISCQNTSQASKTCFPTSMISPPKKIYTEIALNTLNKTQITQMKFKPNKKYKTWVAS